DPEDGGDTNDGGSTTGASADDAGSSNVSSNALVTSIDCAAPGTAISPHVYGIAQEFGNMPDEDWSIGATARRWGGNTTSRYNWRTGHWNTAFDYFWQNVSDDGGGRPHEEFLDENARFGLSSAVTIPMLGWVAGDDRSGSFPVSVVGEQQQVDPFRPDLGNGVRPDGSEIEPPAPSTTSIVSTPDDARAWISSMRSNAAAAGVDEPLVYFLDNEPMLWDSTHRDVFTEPLTYQGLLERTIAYGTAIREAAPDALIAGPSVWGWPAYFFSAADAAAGFDAAPDRRANGGEPLIEWYLAQVRAHEERTGIRLLDVLDVHFYPQDGSYTDDVSDAAVAQRLRSTRSLWDPTYTDPSWIEDTVKLIPRMQDWVDEHAPGTLLSIGEYSFGAEFHISGGLAQAEALGRFGQLGVFAAYYWDVPPSDSSVYWAFRAYTDYDGDGASFGNVSLPVEIDRPLSIFASTTDDRDQMTAVVMNQSLDESLDVMVDLSSCPASAVRAFRHGAGAAGLDPISASLDDDRISLTLPPLSLTVLETT
ncbi:MAG: glycoside hydrolase family 44 protein, partial [Actinomycetota bacterium]